MENNNYIEKFRRFLKELGGFPFDGFKPFQIILFFLFLTFSSPVSAQLGFCEGSKGDAIFHEDFEGLTQLPAGTTSYNYVSGFPNDGDYTISNRNNIPTNGSWHPSLPNTTDSGGQVLVVNADDVNAGLFYRTEISGLCQSTTYEFSAYLSNVYNRSSGVCPTPAGGIPINVRFEIWDETDSYIIQQGSTGDITSTTSPQWEQFALTFQSQAGQQSVILKMYNNGIGGCGNDLAIDDIIFRSCGDLTTVTQEDSPNNRLDVCEEDTPVDINLEATPDFSVYSTHFFQWQESDNGDDWDDIPGETGDTYTAQNLNSTTYYRVKVAESAANLQDNLCSSASDPFLVNVVETPNAPVSNGDQIICSNQSFPPLSVNVESDERVLWYDASTGGNLLAEDTRSFSPTSEGTYYAEAVKEGYDCAASPRTPITFEILEAPEAEDEMRYFCDGSPLTLDAGLANMAYSWSTGENTKTIEVMGAGNYSVEITNSNNCSTTKSFSVVAVDIPTISEVASEGRKVIISMQAEGEFEYSLDGNNFQPSNVFESVNGGIYTAYVRDLIGCKTDTRQFAHLVIPEFITPNNDGHNDYFELKGVSFYGPSEIRIFDRYGKLIKSGAGDNFRWDGTLAGNPLPTGDYWYVIFIEGFEPIKGHFSLVS